MGARLRDSNKNLVSPALPARLVLPPAAITQDPIGGCADCLDLPFRRFWFVPGWLCPLFRLAMDLCKSRQGWLFRQPDTNNVLELFLNKRTAISCRGRHWKRHSTLEARLPEPAGQCVGCSLRASLYFPFLWLTSPVWVQIT